MLILNQNQEAIYNTSKMFRLCVYNKCLFINDDNDNQNMGYLGQFDTNERAQEILYEIFTCKNSVYIIPKK